MLRRTDRQRRCPNFEIGMTTLPNQLPVFFRAGNRRLSCPNENGTRTEHGTGGNGTPNRGMFRVPAGNTAILARPNEQMGIGNMRLGEQFENIGLAVTRTNKANIGISPGPWIDLAEAFEPADAFFFGDRLHVSQILLTFFLLGSQCFLGAIPFCGVARACDFR